MVFSNPVKFPANDTARTVAVPTQRNQNETLLSSSRFASGNPERGGVFLFLGGA